MTAKTVKFLLSDGSTIHVETLAGEAESPEDAAAGGMEIVPRFERAVSRLQPLAGTLLEQVKAADPGKVAIAFALKFDAAGEPVVAAGDEGAAFRITLEWQRGARPPDRQGDNRRGRPFEDRRGDDRRGGYDDRRGPPRGGGPRRPGFRKDRDRDRD
ncbi:MAG: CU044_2847 family protein [Alphaproteobacteria bacterium]|nr:CU044_2847 family protein [Alphaproteobacteria bacterium]MCY3755208.1 CU044_2847 family protein [Alphaproteobacteria bacterium]MYE58435.1 hypothetical protein [Alphaproteobacteria bacterium]